MLADLIREFCNEPENNYEVYENYTKHKTTDFGEEMTITTIGILVKEGCNFFDMLDQLARYMEAKGFDDHLLEIEGMDVDYVGSDAIVYFPRIQNYHPLQS